MMREIRVIRTNATEFESLAVSNTILKVAGTAMGRVKVLVNVCRLGVKISYQSVILLMDGLQHIQEVYLLVWNFWGEFDGSVERGDILLNLKKVIKGALDNFSLMWIFLAAAIFKSLLLKIAATVMIVEFQPSTTILDCKKILKLV